jgi:cell wall-associated NlpC family hydrolase
MRPFALLLTAALVSGCATGPGLARPAPFPTSSRPAPAAPTPIVEDVVSAALEFQGVPYRLGGDTPATGFDCSGFIRYVFGAHQIDVPRTVSEQYVASDHIDLSDIQPGDLLFFATTAPGPSHVAMVTTGHQFVHAPGAGGVVRIESLDAAYWRDRFLGARRVRSGVRR